MSRVARRALVAPDLLTIAETGRRLGVGKTKVYELIGDGELERVKIGAGTRVVADSLDRYLVELRRQ